MTNIVCESRNKSWVTIETCRLRALQRNKTIANIFATFLHPATSISLRIQVQKKFNGYKPWLIDVTFDACKFMKNPKSNKIGKMIWDLIKDCSSVNHQCPYVVSFAQHTPQSQLKLKKKTPCRSSQLTYLHMYIIYFLLYLYQILITGQTIFKKFLSRCRNASINITYWRICIALDMEVL